MQFGCAAGPSIGPIQLVDTLMFQPPLACAKGPSGTHWPKPSPPMDAHSRADCKGFVQSQ
eukprot:scaffold92251_cov73-Phaeocystis_antarctica.AAC.2